MLIKESQGAVEGRGVATKVAVAVASLARHGGSGWAPVVATEVVVVWALDAGCWPKVAVLGIAS